MHKLGIFFLTKGPDVQLELCTGEKTLCTPGDVTRLGQGQAWTAAACTLSPQIDAAPPVLDVQSLPNGSHAKYARWCTCR